MLRYSQFSLYNTRTEQHELDIIKGFYCREAGHSSLFPAEDLLLNCPVVVGNEFCLDPPKPCMIKVESWSCCGHNQLYNVALIIYAPVFMLYDRVDPGV